MGPVVWCALGALVGWFGGRLGSEGGAVNKIEAVLVGIFGSFVGGEFLSTYLLADPSKPNLVQQAGLAIVGAVVALMLLRFMRKAVGPPAKVTKKRRG